MSTRSIKFVLISSPVLVDCNCCCRYCCIHSLDNSVPIVEEQSLFIDDHPWVIDFWSTIAQPIASQSINQSIISFDHQLIGQKVDHHDYFPEFAKSPIKCFHSRWGDDHFDELQTQFQRSFSSSLSFSLFFLPPSSNQGTCVHFHKSNIRHCRRKFFFYCRFRAYIRRTRPSFLFCLPFPASSILRALIAAK